MVWRLAVLSVLVCAALAGAPAAARAAGSAAPASGSSAAASTSASSWFLQPVWAIGGAVKSIGSGAASAWGAVAGLATPFRPSEALPDQIGDDDRRFFAVLNSVGLQLGEIRVEGALISYSNYRFVATRQPSAGDLERAERSLLEYRANSGGPRGWAKQRIARSILDLAGDKNFVLSATVIELSPWPTASYEITALNRPPEAAERRVADSVRPIQ
jgi:hypothetical protein